MNNKECIEDLKNGDLYDEKGFVSEHGYAVLFHAEAHHEIFREDWIPIKMRPGTDEEYEEFSLYGDCPREDFRVFECQLPDDDQEVLVTTRWGDVCIDTWHRDVDCCYFENNSDDEDVIAWMPLPERYEPEVQHDSL